MKGHAFMIMDTMKAAGFSRGGKSIFPNKEMPLSYVNSIAKESGIDSLYETLLRSAAAHKVVNQRREMAKDDLSVSLDTFNAGDDPRRAPPFGRLAYQLKERMISQLSGPRLLKHLKYMLKHVGQVVKSESVMRQKVLWRSTKVPCKNSEWN